MRSILDLQGTLYHSNNATTTAATVSGNDGHDLSTHWVGRCPTAGATKVRVGMTPTPTQSTDQFGSNHLHSILSSHQTFLWQSFARIWL